MTISEGPIGNVLQNRPFTCTIGHARHAGVGVGVRACWSAWGLRLGVLHRAGLLPGQKSVSCDELHQMKRQSRYLGEHIRVGWSL